MDYMSRRSALKTITKVSLGAAAVPLLGTMCGCGDETRITLNVVLHGLFIMNFTNLNIELFTPQIDDHIYKYGSWDQGAVKDFQLGGQYRLKGVDYRSSIPVMDPRYRLVFTQPDYYQHPFDVHPELSRFVVELPFPETIRFIRCVDSGPNSARGTPCFEIRRLSLCQVLSYAVSDYRDLKLKEIHKNTPWKPRVDWSTATANLHFWAEPALRMTQVHAQDAYKKLSDMVAPLQLQLKTNDTVALDRVTGVHGLSPEEEQGWSEWANGGEGSYPTNCGAIITSHQQIP